ncbi:putative protein [BD1-7 clade bacterium]|uniref:DUF1329 domain-containing protein n=1 Tax=BD1-7 clade bacterium TaxID=2029982 RepID=A0A5S9QFT8_9GAMM|nr:putative protein [BD1-7 clade bacterium]CAA0117446.1 putative protein [BD1-7 clade bacterium]
MSITRFLCPLICTFAIVSCKSVDVEPTVPTDNNAARQTEKPAESISESVSKQEPSDVAAAEAANQDSLESAKAVKAEAAKAKAAEEAHLAAEAAAVVEARRTAEAKAAEAEEQARIAAESEAAEAQEQARLANEAQAAEQARIAAEATAVEDARIAAEAQKAEQARIAVQAEKAEKARRAAEQAKLAAAAAAASAAASSDYMPAIDYNGKKLGQNGLTPLGADASGNADGSIPAWTGSMQGVPAGLAYTQSGDIRPDPYGNEEPLLTIHSDNLNEHKNRLSEGQIELFKKYPDSFYIHVYPSHRDGRYNSLWEKRTAFNNENTKLVNGVDGLRNYTGGIPFPTPENGAEVLWNARVAHPQATIMGVLDDIAVYLNGNKQERRQVYTTEFPFSSPSNPVGKVDEEIGINAGLVHITLEKPERQKGQMTVVHEALDQVTHDRKAWVYVPGSRRVRRAPTVGHDTPDGPGGLVTIDDSLGFNGAMDRYEWSLLGRKEVYIPYHTYKFDSPDVDYETLLESGHANPEFMRYELHRVWVVEANLKADARHVYAKRRFYIDEDSWHITLLESYDGRGDLWRVGVLNTVYDFAVKGYVARAQMFHDLQSGGYISLRMINETSPSNLMGQPKGERYYSPANLRKLGTR